MFMVSMDTVALPPLKCPLPPMPWWSNHTSLTNCPLNCYSQRLCNPGTRLEHYLTLSILCFASLFYYIWTDYSLFGLCPSLSGLLHLPSYCSVPSMLQQDMWFHLFDRFIAVHNIHNHIFLICLSAVGILGCFHILAIVLSVTMNIGPFAYF